MTASEQNKLTMSRSWRCFSMLAVAGIVCAGALRADDNQGADSQGTAAAAIDRIDFTRDIRPLLSDRCFHCHGPDAEQRQADLRLDTQEGALADLGGYGAVVPGDIPASQLIARITSDDPDERMPPPEAARKLSAEEIDKFKRWVAEGAEWEGHWSFQSVQVPDVPEVNDKRWIRNPIDAFVLARLESAGFSPAPELDRGRLLRRVSLNLTGLPPSLEQLDRFLSDADPNAYEKAVDRLLDSPRFAERVTSIWLDAARYSDTYGYQVDRDRYVWPWRDWVIGALNANMPYDEFIHNQLAGDLLPDADASQILATTFNRLHPQKTEGGSVPEEFRTQYVADRLETVSTALLGLTMECCRCHDHKYDPISQREYYQLFAFFNNIDEAGLYSYSTQSIPTPTLWLPTESQQQAIAKASERVQQAEADLVAVADRQESEVRRWAERPSTESAAAPQRESQSPKATAETKDTAEAKDNAGAEPNAEPNTEPAEEGPPHRIAWLDFEQDLPRGCKAVDGYRGQGVELSGDDAVGTQVGDFRRYDPFTIALAIRAKKHPKRAVVFHRSLGWTDAGSRGYELLLEDGRLSAGLVHFWPGNAIRIRTREKIPLDRWSHVTVSYDGSSRAEGLVLYLDGKKCEVEVVRDNLTKEIAGGDGDRLRFGARNRDSGFRGGQIDEVAVFDRQLSELEIDALAGGDALEKFRGAPFDTHSPDARAQLQSHYLLAESEAYANALSALRDARAEAASASGSVTEIMVMQEMPQARETFLLTRGAYDQPAEPVDAKTPEIFPSPPGTGDRNRLTLAQWLTDPSHPLTARVAVNRFWQMIFGEGLVRTPEDFGTQGQVPTHPQLLDYLAARFVSEGWDIKRLLREMVTSATYLQSGRGEGDLLDEDPENRLLGRYERRQLPAEMLRDAALLAGGLLIERRGGPPVRPYEVAVSFKPVKRDSGEGLYRRSLYTYWKRTGPAPAMMALDASKRDVCRVRRPRTQSPLQALVLLNDPQFVEAARRLSERLLAEVGDENFVIAMFRTLIGRDPTLEERSVVEQLYDAQREHFAAHRAEADEARQIGDAAGNPELPPAEVAAGAVLASLLMNFEGFTRMP